MNMKLNKILYVLFIALAVGCAKDKGNYKYDKEIKISVKGIAESVSGQSAKPISITPDIYVIEGKDTVDIFLQSRTDLEPNDERTKLTSDLSFAWEVRGKLISSEMNLNNAIEGVGSFYARYVVTVNKTGVSYYFPFTVKLTSPFAAGYFAFARDETSKSILTFKSTRKGEENEPVINIDNINGVELGTNPVSFGIEPTQSGPTSYSNYKLYINSANDGNNGKTIITDLMTFDYLGFTDKYSVEGGVPDDFAYNLEASYSAAYLIISGKMHKGEKGLVYRASAPNVDYKLAPWVGTGGSFMNTCLLAFDEKNDRFLHFIKAVSDPVGGIIADPNALDRVTEIVIQVNGVDNPTFMKGHRFLAGGIHGRNPLTLKAITENNGNLYFYSFIQNWDVPNFHIPVTRNFEGSITIPGINENSCATLSAATYDWYVSAGNKIYSTTSESVKAYKDVFTLPVEAGDIVKMELITKYVTEMVTDPISGVTEPKEVAKSCILAATYNSSALGDLRGSIYVINLTDNNIMESYPNCTGRTVTLFNSLMD